MSHIAQYASSLTRVNQDLFKKAMELVAEKLNGTLGQSIGNGYYGGSVDTWNGHKIVVSVQTKNFPSGMGVYFDTNGKPIFVTNADGHQSERRSIQAEVEKAYKALAIAAALQQMGYQVEASSTDEVVVIQGQRASA